MTNPSRAPQLAHAAAGTGTAHALGTGLEAAPLFRGPLENQRPRIVMTMAGDPWLLLAVAGLVGIGLVMVFNVSWFPGDDDFRDPLHFFKKHFVSILLGTTLGFVASRVRSDAYRRLAYPLLGVALVGLVLVLIPGIGVERSGARRWLPLGPLAFQPSELAKLALVIYLAASLARKGPRIRELGFGVLPHCMVVGLVAGLCLLEPDFGTAALSTGILVAMLWAAGARLMHLGLFAAAALPGLAFLVIMEPYRMRRLASFLDYTKDPQGMGYQLLQSLIAFASGELTGAGLGMGQQKMHFLPAAHTDFIFAVIGEELGLLGAFTVMALFTVLLVRGLRIAMRHPDAFAGLLAFGLTVHLVLQGMLNIGVALGCLPTKGLTLPFVSYGGSAMMLALLEAGVLVGLAREAG
ncbi:MAG: putative lipid II flippase FtsW [bacterium]|nr:putative lipid II flippase FtsW [bacterium]